MTATSTTTTTKQVARIKNVTPVQLPKRLLQPEPQPPQLERIVVLRYKSCCGCGCDWVKLERKVPMDSPLKDGDKVTTALANDKILGSI